ncbi:MAG: hypothetical protein LBP78_06015 [Acidaminococcales bacterium]|jgi:hypothetical protein|nr:hypothetical protein [Acidaminococcales bacterium]
MDDSLKTLNDMSLPDLKREIAQGARFVVFPYCVSIVVMTFRRSSRPYFLRATQSSLPAALKYILVSLLFGWWGIPWGPIYTVGSLFANLSGGKDITKEIMEDITGASGG